MRSLRLATGAGILALVVSACVAEAGAPAATTHDLSGTWKIDRAKSDPPGPPPHMRGLGAPGGQQGGGMGGPGEMGGGMGGPPEGMGGGPPEGGGGGEMHGHGGGGEGGPPAEGERGQGGDRGMRRPGLPPYMQITSGADVIAIADSAGALVQQITLKDLPADSPAIEKGVIHVPGAWKGDKLTVTRTNSRGVKITETFALEDKGNTLVVRTKMEQPDGTGFENKRVYHRAG